MSLQIWSGTSTRKVKTLVLEDGTALTTCVRCSLWAARVWSARDTNEKRWTEKSLQTEDVSVGKAIYNLYIPNAYRKHPNRDVHSCVVWESKSCLSQGVGLFVGFPSVLIFIVKFLPLEVESRVAG